jgi:hypothetical protein
MENKICNEEVKTEIVKKEFRDNSLLSRQGFSLSTEWCENSKLIGHTYVFVFSHPSYKRILNIRFSPAFKELGDSLDLYIHKEDGHSLDVSEYLRQNGLCSNKNHFRLETYPGDFKTQLKQFMKFLEMSFEKYWKNFLIGTDWVNVPFDWGDYK